MLRAKHMGFRSVKLVEVKAETTTPGEVRTTTDATGARVSTSRARRTLPKLEFSVDEDGAILHGPQRGALPQAGLYSSSSGSASNFHSDTSAERDGLYQSASFHALHMRDFPSPPSVRNSYFFDELDDAAAAAAANTKRHATAAAAAATSASVPVPPMKECVLNDTRATTMAIKYDAESDKFVCGSSIERFSGHTGVCRVLGSKKYPVTPHSLQIGDLLRIGSVGLVVCELNRTAREETQEALSESEYAFLKEHYLSLPLQQTFHPTTPAESHGQPPPSASYPRGDDCDDTAKPRSGLRAGETSDEGESEEDRRAGSHARASESDRAQDALDTRSLGASGVAGKTFCYICYDGDDEPETNPLVAPCDCKGDTKYVHLNCLQRWNSNLDADGANASHRVCAVTNTDGLDVCTICKATYRTSVALDDGRVVSLLAQKLAPPYVTFAVVTQHETRNRQTALTNTRFQLSFANMPRNQQYLTIGRSTTNNMTLRYRTVSQLHAKIKYQDDNFFLYDALSSNGTMLFLSRPLELEWNKTVHVKIGRTILTLKSKKRWRWSGGASSEHAASSNTHALETHAPAESPPSSHAIAADALATTPTHRANGVSPPPHAPARASTTSHTRALQRSAVPNRFESAAASSVRDPSAELVGAPFGARPHLPAPLSFAARRGFTETEERARVDALVNAHAASMRLSDLVEEEPMLVRRTNAALLETALTHAQAAATDDSDRDTDARERQQQQQQQQEQQQQQQQLHDDNDDDEEDADALFYEMADRFDRVALDECDVVARERAASGSAGPVAIGDSTALYADGA